MEFLITYFSPTFFQLGGLLSVLLVSLGLTVIGGAIGGRERFVPADILCGWAVAVIAFTLVGTLTPIPFTYVGLALSALAIACAVYIWRRDGRLIPQMALKILVLTAPLFFLISAMSPSQWDEYSHWLLASRYLVDFDGFPGPGMPQTIMDYPAYPYGSPIIYYLVSRLTGGFVENTGALFHIVLLISMALAVIELIRKGGKLQNQESWSLAALGFLAVTALSTAFVQKVVFTAYADLPTSVGLAFVGIIGWMIIDRLVEKEIDQAKILAWQFGLILSAFIYIKPANVTLATFVIVGIGLAALREPNLKIIKFLKLLPALMSAAIITFVVWKVYTSLYLPHGSMTIRSFAYWGFDTLPQTLSTMVTIMLKKGAYFGMMWTLSLFGLWSLFTYKGAFGRFSIIVGACFVGYNLFLVFSYLAIFSGYTSTHALSYWRYNMHLAHLGAACSAFGLAIFWRYKLAERMNDQIPKIGFGLITILLILPLVFAPKLRFDLRAPKQFVKLVGSEIASILPKGARVFVLDPQSAGFYTKLMRYQLYGVATLTGDITVFSDKTPNIIRERLVNSKTTHVWVHTQTDVILEVLGIYLSPQNTHLLAKQGKGWRLLKSWPYPGYNQPQDIPD